jgi:hypothetical protein
MVRNMYVVSRMSIIHIAVLSRVILEREMRVMPVSQGMVSRD